MSEHVHGCSGCVPDMVPVYDDNDPRHISSDSEIDKFRWGNPLLNGVEVLDVVEALAGTDGWVRFNQRDEHGQRHGCPCDNREACCAALRGNVEFRRRKLGVAS